MRGAWFLPALSLLLVASLPPIASAAGQRPVVAVFDVECGPRVELPRVALDGLAEYISSRLTESGRYQVVPRDQIKERLVQEKANSYRECYDQSCQIEIGKELAAEKTLATRVVQLGSHCTVSLTFYDLRKAATEAAATQNGGCGEDEVVDSLDKALGKLFGGSNRPDSPASGRPQPAASPAGLEWVHSTPAGIDFTRSEVTVAQYRACLEAGRCTRPKTKSDSKYCNWGWPDRDRHPVDCVAWNQAQAFCEWVGGRLPTEDEWYAEASNKGSRQYPWGDEEVSCDRAIWGDGNRTDGCGRRSTWPVCSKPEGNSTSGLCDMSGNVWEWTSSFYSDGGNDRAVRGGAWYFGVPDSLRTSKRNGRDPTRGLNYGGFRCGRTPR